MVDGNQYRELRQGITRQATWAFRHSDPRDNDVACGINFSVDMVVRVLPVVCVECAFHCPQLVKKLSPFPSLALRSHHRSGNDAPFARTGTRNIRFVRRFDMSFLRMARYSGRDSIYEEDSAADCAFHPVLNIAGVSHNLPPMPASSLSLEFL